MAAGPWIQEPDYDAVVFWDRDDQTRALIARGWPERSAGQGYTEETADVPYPPPYPLKPYADLPTVLSTALMSDDDDPGVGTSHGRVSLRYGTAVVGLYGQGSAEARAAASIAPVLPGTPSEDGGYSPFAFWPENQPDGAVDVEFEGDPYGRPSWLSVEIDPETTLIGSISEQVTTGGTTTTRTIVSRPFASEIRAHEVWPGPTLGSVVDVMETGPGDYTVAGVRDDNASRALGHTVPLTGAISAAGIGVVWLRTPDYLEVSTPPDGNAGEWRWQYGWGFNRLRLRWRLRPPRYRWLYDTPAIRRTFPRDDALAGGAARTWPPSRAVQSSNRTHGGYL